jgi:sRNA-binding protein
MKSSEVVSSILSGEFTPEQIDDIIVAVKQFRQKNVTKVTTSLNIGDNVKWRSSRMGMTATGSVVKILRKNVHVKVHDTGMIWAVSANLITKL